MRVHIAGNSVLDLPLRYAPDAWGDGHDGWASGNVHFLKQPVDGILGGCGAATAYVLGRLGASVSLNTQIGEDPLGQVVRTWLDDARVVLTGAPAAHTAVNVIPLGEDGTRRSLYYTGVKVDWRQSIEVAADWFFASGYGQVTAEDLAVLSDMFQTLRTRGTKVVFDPSPWFMSCANRDTIRDIWSQVDVLTGTEEELNTHEACVSVDALLDRLLEMGPEWVVVKRGADGAAFGGQTGVCGVVAAERVDRAYTVGAGDTFNAGILHGLSTGKPMDETVVCAVNLATRAVRSGRGALGAV